MKKRVKKLELAKETVRDLGADKFPEVHGGACATGPAISCLFTASVHSTC
jgi:hypothetical protein